MSNRELAKSLIDQIPESKLIYIISYLQGAAVPDETPNADNRNVNIICTIPSWLNEKAEAANINFSAVLQEALKQRLQIN